MYLITLSPRVAPGLLTGRAWQIMAAADRIMAGVDDEHVAALRAGGLQIEVVSAAQVEPGSNDVWLAVPGDRVHNRPSGPGIVEVTGVEELSGSRLLDVVAVLERLRRECAWTAAQTHQSLRRYLLEETYEALEALDSGDSELLCEELGDLLMQVVLHAQIAQGWDIDDVAETIAEKLVRRSPHVFADGTATTAAEVATAWCEIKATEKLRDQPLDGAAAALPALAFAVKALERVEDLDTSGDDLGSRLLQLVEQALAAGIDPETALRTAIKARI